MTARSDIAKSTCGAATWANNCHPGQTPKAKLTDPPNLVPSTIGMLFAVNTLDPPMDREHTSKRKSIADESPRSEQRNHRRTDDRRSNDTASVRLIRKYAEMIDGVSLEDAEVGDRLELPKRDADVLIAEGWAERAADDRPVRLLPGRAHAADSPRKKRKS